MARPVALIMAFSKNALPGILEEIARPPQPPVAEWFVGTYGISNVMAGKIAATGSRYAPVFGIQVHTTEKVRAKRQVPKADASKLDRAFAGKIPGGGAVIPPPPNRREWGIEMGQRFRDAMRKWRARHVVIDTWQFDEILARCASDAAYREFVGGILRGLAEGRPKLGDKLEKGFVWSAFTALRDLPGPAASDEIERFWDDLARAALFLVGEEYPFFRGSFTTAARDRAVGHRHLIDVHRELARKYVCGMTPGWKQPSPGLRGNVDGKPPEFVTTWRKGFIDARIALERPRGFGHFNFVEGNVRADHLKDAVASLRFASERLGP
jgi:hypothetical protein